MLPEGIQFVIKVFPVSHAALLLRQVMMDAPMQSVFAGAPTSALTEFQQQMGVAFEFGGTRMTTLTSILILIGAALLFYALSIWRYSRKSK